MSEYKELIMQKNVIQIPFFVKFIDAINATPSSIGTIYGVAITFTNIESESIIDVHQIDILKTSTGGKLDSESIYEGIIWYSENQF